MSDDNGFLDTTSPVRYQASRRVAMVAMGVNSVLVIGQILAGIIGNSQALVADGLHTLADLCTDLLVLYALKHSVKEADEEHPYGHARIETAVTLVLGVIMIVVGGGIALRAGLRIMGDTPFIAPTALALWVAGATILAKELLYHYTLRIAHRFESDLLKASAWHHRSDAISSIIVFIGIAGSMAGVTWLDAAAAMGVALFVFKIGLQLGWPAIKELIDTGLDPEDLQRIRKLILDVDGVRALHFLRTRRLGGRALVDVHIIVDDNISVSEGHYISEIVRARLMEEVDVVADALVHIDPEDDTQATPVRNLPSRAAVQTQLLECFREIEASDYIESITLHYVGGCLRVELLLPLTVLTPSRSVEELADLFRAAISNQPHIGTLELRFH